jgi:hypothetical protein
MGEVGNEGMTAWSDGWANTWGKNGVMLMDHGPWARRQATNHILVVMAPCPSSQPGVHAMSWTFLLCASWVGIGSSRLDLPGG